MMERSVEHPKPRDSSGSGEPAPNRMKQLAGIALEGLVSLSLALLCFLAFLWVLDTVFPSSVGLRREFVLDAPRHEKWGVDRLPGGPRAAAAVLRVFSNEVKVRTPDQIAWGPARHGGAVSEGDAIQTTRDGEAMLRFSDGSALQLGRNSLLVVRSREERDAGAAAFLVPKGELWGTLPAASEDGGEVSVNTPTAVVRVGTAAGSKTRADFKVLVGPDRSSIVAVYHGSASVTSGDRTQEVTENHFIAVDSSGTQSAIAKLPDAPTLTGPADGARFTYSDPPPRFTFQWTPVAGADGYRLVVARDAGFQTIVLDRSLDSPQLEFGRLSTGDYVWRVSTVRDRVEGRPSAIAALHITQDGAAPHLEVEFPDGIVASEEVTITGNTDGDSRVLVAGQPASVDRSGAFSCRVRLKRGLNVVVVEALDPAGNAAYSSKVLEARY